MMIVLKVPWNKEVVLKYDLSTKNITCIFSQKDFQTQLISSKDVGYWYNVVL